MTPDSKLRVDSAGGAVGLVQKPMTSPPPYTPLARILGPGEDKLTILNPQRKSFLPLD